MEAARRYGRRYGLRGRGGGSQGSPDDLTVPQVSPDRAVGDVDRSSGENRDSGGGDGDAARRGVHQGQQGYGPVAGLADQGDQPNVGEGQGGVANPLPAVANLPPGVVGGVGLGNAPQVPASVMDNYNQAFNNIYRSATQIFQQGILNLL